MLPGRVYVQHTRQASYPSELENYSPSKEYPEYPFEYIATCPNVVYGMVRSVFFDMGLDIGHYGTPQWNPLGEIIKKGEVVVIKPNMVMDSHGCGGSMDCLITHGSVIRAALDYVYIALGGTGRVILGDAPLQKCDFGRVTALNGADRILQFYRDNANLDVELVDFRLERAIIRGGEGSRSRRIIAKDALPGDRRGYTVVNLGKRSLLDEISCDYEKFRVTNYDPRQMLQHHNRETHEYLIPNSLLQADVVINLPKIKTHRKAGLTACLKNLVGINGQKDWLPHHRRGSCQEGGDEYPFRNALRSAEVGITERIDALSKRKNQAALRFPLRALRRALSCGARLTERSGIREGSWFGNDTVWRTVLDLNRILLYSGKEGGFERSKQREVLHLADGIVVGEGEGPLAPAPKAAGILVAGRDPVATDAVIAKLLGFDYEAIPLLARAWRIEDRPLTDLTPGDVAMSSNDEDWDGAGLCSRITGIPVEPPRGWKGHIEAADFNV